MKEETSRNRTILINGVATDIGIANGDNLGTFLMDISKSLSQESEVISSIRINGKELEEADEAKFKDMPLTSFESIEIQTANPADLAYETLDTLDLYVDRLIAGLQKAASSYKEKNLIAGDDGLAKSIDGIDLFIQTIGGVKLALRVGLNPKIALAESELVSIMNDLLETKRQNNYVFLAELLEKDLVQNLNSWKSEAFPVLRKWRTA